MTPDIVSDRYFRWLCKRVDTSRHSRATHTYTMLCDRMHRIIFDDSVPNDDNRAADGKELRRTFLGDLDDRYRRDVELFMEPEASLFEVIVGVCGRANFIVEIGEPAWFEIFLKNLDLDTYSDVNFTSRDELRVIRILHRLNDRKYTPSGRGGLFPLKIPSFDQRKVEIWFQMAAYMTENAMY
jgi:hypothetical protein